MTPSKAMMSVEMPSLNGIKSSFAPISKSPAAEERKHSVHKDDSGGPQYHLLEKKHREREAAVKAILSQPVSKNTTSREGKRQPIANRMHRKHPSDKASQRENQLANNLTPDPASDILQRMLNPYEHLADAHRSPHPFTIKTKDRTESDNRTSPKNDSNRAVKR